MLSNKHMEAQLYKGFIPSCFKPETASSAGVKFQFKYKLL